MREVRATAAAVLLLLMIAAPSFGQCVSSVETISARGTRPRFLAGPTAWNGSILAVAGAELDREQFQVILYDEHGVRLFPNENIRSSGEHLLDVLWNGSEFGVFSETATGVLALTRATTTGRILEPRVIAIPAVDVDGEDVHIAWHPELAQYVVAHTITSGAVRDIRVTWLRRDGTVVRETTIDDATPESFVRVGVTASGTIGVFYEDEKTEDVFYVAINGETKRRPVSVWSPGQDLVLTTRVNQFVLVRPQLASTGDTVARWQVLDSSGGVVRRDSRLILGTGGHVEPLAITTRGSEYALSYLEWSDGIGVGDPFYRLARFGLDEERISDTYFAAASGTRRRRERTEYDFEWTGSAYVSLASLENGDDDDTYLLRLCPLRATISAPRFAYPQQRVTFTAAGDGGVPGYTYTWTWGDFGTAQGATAQISFATPGTHRVTLTTKDASGTTSVETFDIAIGEVRRRAVRK